MARVSSTSSKRSSPPINISSWSSLYARPKSASAASRRSVRGVEERGQPNRAATARTGKPTGLKRSQRALSASQERQPVLSAPVLSDDDGGDEDQHHLTGGGAGPETGSVVGEQSPPEDWHSAAVLEAVQRDRHRALVEEQQKQELRLLHQGISSHRAQSRPEPRVSEEEEAAAEGLFEQQTSGQNSSRAEASIHDLFADFYRKFQYGTSRSKITSDVMPQSQSARGTGEESGLSSRNSENGRRFLDLRFVKNKEGGSQGQTYDQHFSASARKWSNSRSVDLHSSTPSLQQDRSNEPGNGVERKAPTQNGRKALTSRRAGGDTTTASAPVLPGYMRPRGSRPSSALPSRLGITNKNPVNNDEGMRNSSSASSSVFKSSSVDIEIHLIERMEFARRRKLAPKPRSQIYLEVLNKIAEASPSYAHVLTQVQKGLVECLEQIEEDARVAKTQPELVAADIEEVNKTEETHIYVDGANGSVPLEFDSREVEDDEEEDELEEEVNEDETGPFVVPANSQGSLRLDLLALQERLDTSYAKENELLEEREMLRARTSELEQTILSQDQTVAELKVRLQYLEEGWDLPAPDRSGKVSTAASVVGTEQRSPPQSVSVARGASQHDSIGSFESSVKGPSSMELINKVREIELQLQEALTEVELSRAREMEAVDALQGLQRKYSDKLNPLERQFKDVVEAGRTASQFVPEDDNQRTEKSLLQHLVNNGFCDAASADESDSDDESGSDEIRQDRAASRSGDVVEEEEEEGEEEEEKGGVSDFEFEESSEEEEPVEPTNRDFLLSSPVPPFAPISASGSIPSLNFVSLEGRGPLSGLLSEGTPLSSTRDDKPSCSRDASSSSLKSTGRSMSPFSPTFPQRVRPMMVPPLLFDAVGLEIDETPMEEMRRPLTPIEVALERYKAEKAEAKAVQVEE